MKLPTKEIAQSLGYAQRGGVCALGRKLKNGVHDWTLLREPKCGRLVLLPSDAGVRVSSPRSEKIIEAFLVLRGLGHQLPAF